MAAAKLSYYSWRPFDFRNFGDELSALIAERVAGRALRITHRRGDNPKLLGAGSILDHALDNDYLWGTGSKGFPEMPAKVTALAVRGPLTKAHLERAGIACPDVLGDPALLTPRLFPEIRREKKRSLGIVLHYLDTRQRTLFRALWPIRRRYSPELIDVGWPPLKVMSEIAACEQVISTSLHGVILADAFGVPCQLIAGREYQRFPFKFQDYFLSVGREWREPPSVFDPKKPAPLPPPRLPELDRLLAAFPHNLLA